MTAAPAAGASGSGSSGPAVEMISDASGAKRPRTGARHGPAGAVRDQGHNRVSRESDSRGEVPDRRGEPVRVRPAVKRRRRQVDYVLLSFFDGIGAAPAILEHTHGKAPGGVCVGNR